MAGTLARYDTTRACTVAWVVRGGFFYDVDATRQPARESEVDKIMAAVQMAG